MKDGKYAWKAVRLSFELAKFLIVVIGETISLLESGAITIS